LGQNLVDGANLEVHLEKLRLGLDRPLNAGHMPLLVAIESGWATELGVSIELVAGGPQLQPMEEIEAARLEVVVADPVRLVRERAKGLPAVGFARFLHTNGGVMFLPGSGIERPRQMAGKRIQYPEAPDPGGLAIVRTMIEADGAECDPTEFTPVNFGHRHVDALIEGRADVATPAFFNLEMIEALGRGARPSLFALKDWGVPDFCQLVLFTSEDLLFERRQALHRLVRLVRRGIDFLHERPGAALEIFRRSLGRAAQGEIGERVFRATLSCFPYDLSMSHDYYARLGHWLMETGQVPRVPDRFAYWSNELVV
jgi:ABC-type nitrate/sulfonate/bicarbonate transport system substrate-binding protein